MSSIGLFYAAMMFVAGIFIGYFWLVARSLAKQVVDLQLRLKTAYELLDFFDGLEKSELEKIEVSED